jgi:hypothetical protein
LKGKARAGAGLALSMPTSATTAASETRDDFIIAPLRGLMTAENATLFSRRQRGARVMATFGVDLVIGLSSLRTRED